MSTFDIAGKDVVRRVKLYAKAQGSTEVVSWEYMSWTSNKWQQYFREVIGHPLYNLTDEQHRAFDDWLEIQADKEAVEKNKR
jgi:hypothetical protein